MDQVVRRFRDKRIAPMNRQGLYLQALSGRAEVYHFIGRMKPAVADLEVVLSCAGEPGLKQEALCGLTSLYSDLGDYRRESSLAGRLVAIARGRDQCSMGKALIMKAAALRDLGDYESSLRAAGQAVRLFRAAQEARGLSRIARRKIQEHVANAYQTMGQVNNLQGRYDSALDFYGKSLEIVEAIGDQPAIALRLNNIGLVHWRRGRFEKARAFYKRSLAIGERIGWPFIVASAHNNLGNICYETERYGDARDHHRRALRINQAIGNRSGAANNYNNLGLCYGSEWDLDNALKHFTMGLNIFRKIGHTYGHALNLNNIGMIHCERGDYGKAASCEKGAERIARQAGMSDILLRCLMLKARVYRAQGKYGRSFRTLKEAISSGRRSKIESLRIDAVMQYLKTAVEAGDMAGTADYVRQVERAYRRAAINYDQCFALITLVQCALARKDHRDAKRKYSSLSGLIKRCVDRKLVIQFLVISARLDFAAGQDPRPRLMKAKGLARACGLRPIVDEANTLEKEYRSSPASRDRGSRPS